MFKSIDDLKDTLSTVNVASTIDQVGFIEPGHGACCKRKAAVVDRQ